MLKSARNSEVLDAKVVGAWLPFHSTWEPEMNCVPVTVNVNAGPPAVALDGESEVIVGVGFGGVLIVKLSAPDATPPGAGFCTTTLAVPVELRSDAGISADSEVLDAKVVASAAPFHSITEAGTKPLPDAVRVSAALPSAAEFGLIPLSVGAGFCGSEELPCDPPPPPQPSSRQKRRDRKKRHFQRTGRITCAPMCQSFHQSRILRYKSQ